MGSSLVLAGGTEAGGRARKRAQAQKTLSLGEREENGDMLKLVVTEPQNTHPSGGKGFPLSWSGLTPRASSIGQLSRPLMSATDT